MTTLPQGDASMSDPLAADSRPRLEISFLMPILWGGDETISLVSEIVRQLNALDRSYELLLIVDGVQSSLLERLEALRSEVGGDLRVVSLMRTFGESTALAVGFEEARGEVIIACSENMDVELAGLEPVLDRLASGVDLVVGMRHPRSDSRLNRLQSRFFHGLVRWLTSTRFTDITSGFRAMRREVAMSLDLYGDLYNFIPILAHSQGFTVEEVPMKQWVREEAGGGEIYGPQVYLRRFVDILTVFFLTRFTQRPLRFFGVFGLLTLAGGAGILGYLGGYRLLGLGGIADRPLLLLGLLLVVLGVQSLSIGLLGELVIFTRARRTRPYRVAEVVRAGKASESDRSPELG